MFHRNHISCEWVAQMSTHNSMFPLGTCMETSSAIKNSVHIVHGHPCFSQELFVSKTTRLQWFSAIISTCLLLFTLSSNAIFALAIFFPMTKLAFQWQHTVWKATVWEVHLISVYTSCGSHHSSNNGSLSSHRSIISVLMTTLSPTGVMHTRPAIWCSQTVNIHSLSQACTNFPKIHHQHQKCRHKKGNMTKGPYCRPTNIRCHLTKFWYLG